METGGTSHDEQEVYDYFEEVVNGEGSVRYCIPEDSNTLESSVGRDHMCPEGTHQWRHHMCMVCTVCQECTGYSISCLSSMRPDRKPGQ